MLKVLIDGHPAGWSSIKGADLNLPLGYSEWPNQDTLCESCGKENWRRYKQYYKGKKERLPARKHWNPTNDFTVLEHSQVHSWENEPPLLQQESSGQPILETLLVVRSGVSRLGLCNVNSQQTGSGGQLINQTYARLGCYQSRNGVNNVSC